MLAGAAIAFRVKNPILAIIFAFLSHFVLDFIPHNEYNVKNIKSKNWQKSGWDFLKIFLDFSAGILLIFLFSDKQAIIFIAAFFSILPDGFSFLSYVFPSKFLQLFSNFHQKKMHFFKYKKISNFWRIFSQILTIISSLLCLYLGNFF